MNIIGNGVDIVDNKRIEKLLLNNNFLNRIFTNSEIKSSKKSQNKINFFAKRFAAKEAFSKAFGTGLGRGIYFNEIIILNDFCNFFIFNIIRFSHFVIINFYIFKI